MKFTYRVKAIVLVYIIMFLISMADTVRGTFTTYIKTDFIVGDSKIGIMFMVCSLSYMIFAYIGGALVYKLGHKNLIMTGLVIAVVSIFKIYFSYEFNDLLIGLFLLNAGEGFLLVSLNTYIPTINSRYKGLIMNLLHIFYGIGALTIQSFSGILIKYNITWKIVHIIIALCLLLCLISLLVIPLNSTSSQCQKGFQRSKSSPNKYLIILYIFALGSYTAAEICTSNWFVSFLTEGLKLPYNKASSYLSLFYILITFGKVTGGYLADKIGYLKLSFFCILSGFFMYILGYIIFHKGIILIPLSGIFLSIYFPTMLLTINRAFKESSIKVLSTIMSTSSLFCMALNFFMGLLSERFSIYTSFLLVPISLCISAICTTLICYETFKSERVCNENFQKPA